MSGKPDLYIDESQWGLRACSDAPGSFHVLGEAWTLLTTFIPSLPSDMDECFAISGPMTGNGLPIRMDLVLILKR